MTLFTLGDKQPSLPEAGDCFIAHDANVIGDCRIGAGASIWFGCTLRGDNEPIHVGEGVNIQENSVLHTDIGFPLTLERGVSVGHKAMLHGCTVEEGALIGMGAIVLNGAVIGAGSLVGAGALIPEGKVIPPGVMVLGSPGKVVRELTDQHKAIVAATSQHYRDRSKEYREGLVALS